MGNNPSADVNQARVRNQINDPPKQIQQTNQTRSGSSNQTRSDSSSQIIIEPKQTSSDKTNAIVQKSPNPDPSNQNFSDETVPESKDDFSLLNKIADFSGEALYNLNDNHIYMLGHKCYKYNINTKIYYPLSNTSELVGKILLIDNNHILSLSNDILLYKIKENEWKIHDENKFEGIMLDRTAAIVKENDTVHITGGWTIMGCDSHYMINQNQLIDPVNFSNTHTCVKLPKKIHLHGMSLDYNTKQPIIFGGIFSNDIYDSIYKYNSENGIWELMNDTLPKKMYDFGYVTTNDNKFVILFGGMQYNEEEKQEEWTNSIYYMNLNNYEIKRSEMVFSIKRCRPSLTITKDNNIHVIHYGIHSYIRLEDIIPVYRSSVSEILGLKPFCISNPLIVIIGVSDYEEGNSTLHSAKKDIVNLVELFSSKMNIFDIKNQNLKFATIKDNYAIKVPFHENIDINKRIINESHVQILVNPTRQQTKIYLHNLQETLREKLKQDHKKWDSLVFIGSGHGVGNSFICSDNNPIDIDNEFIIDFNNKNCEYFKGCPKLYLIDACRSQDVNNVNEKRGSNHVNTHLQIHQQADTYIAYSTVSGELADSAIEGGYLIYHFYKNLKLLIDAKLESVDIHTLFTKINDVINNNIGGTQCCEMKSFLRYPVNLKLQ